MGGGRGLVSWLRPGGGKMPVFMPWPQSGRMQYEKIKIKKGWNECVDLEGGGWCPQTEVWFMAFSSASRTKIRAKASRRKANLYGRYQQIPY
jgi:hypothetical protein